MIFPDRRVICPSSFSIATLHSSFNQTVTVALVFSIFFSSFALEPWIPYMFRCSLSKSISQSFCGFFWTFPKKLNFLIQVKLPYKQKLPKKFRLLEVFDGLRKRDIANFEIFWKFNFGLASILNYFAWKTYHSCESTIFFIILVLLEFPESL